MTAKPALGIRAQIALLAVVPLGFLVLTLVLLMLLVRIGQQSSLVVQRVTRVVGQSDLMTQTVGRMSNDLSLYAKSGKRKGLPDYVTAKALLERQRGEMQALVRDDPVLAPAAARYVKGNAAVARLFDAGLHAFQTGGLRGVARIIEAPSTKALAAELEAAKANLSTTAATLALAANAAGRRSTAEAERTLVICASLGVISTIALAVLFGLRLARRLGTLADNARRLRAGEAPSVLGGSDEVTQLDRVYRQMFEQTAVANREAERLKEAERAAKVRLEVAVQAYGAFAAEVASGELSSRIAVDDPDDELGRLGTRLNAMAASLERLVGEIRTAATSLASATAEILAATNQQVASATEEATAVRQTAVTVLEVRQTAELAAHKARLVAELAQRVQHIAADGRQSVEESVRGTGESRERMEVLAERILAFSDQAQSIAEINATVATLAEQSNLLAVNAGIEAAKAGEAGRGFAVVAAEVKDLGARSKEATIQVRRIVAEIQRSAQNAVIAAEQGMRVAESGTAVAQRSGEAMNVLAASVAEASDAARQISASTEQQQAGMDQIALAMQSIEQASVQSVAATQQVERAASDLSRLAQQLSDTIANHVRADGPAQYDLIN